MPADAPATAPLPLHASPLAGRGLRGRAAVIHLATSDAHPELTADDRLLASALHGMAARWRALRWRSGALPAAGDLVVIRSCWDYHLDADGFLAWLDRLEANGVRVANGYHAIRETLHKRYLFELAERHGAVLPAGRLVTRGTGVALAELVRALGSADLVVKPAVSLSAHGTWRVGDLPVAAASARFEAQLAGADLIVQRYVPEIAQGELSLVFIGGEYSHAVRKRPAEGDFRVQADHGGSHAAIDPPAALVRQAADLLGRYHPEAAYARVDGVDVGGRFVLMELELIDPVLFLATHAPAAERLARVLAAA